MDSIWGMILSMFVLKNNSCGCGIFMWRYGEFGNLVILSSSLEVQSEIFCCFRYVLHASMEGLIVITSA